MVVFVLENTYIYIDKYLLILIYVFMCKCKICGNTDYPINTKNFLKIFVPTNVMKNG